MLHTAVASDFGVSTTPVRDALRQLSCEGLVSLDSYRGGVVTVVDRREIEEIVHLSQLLEPLAIEEVVALMTPAIISAAEEIVTLMAATDRWDVWVLGNRAFHEKVYEPSLSRQLVALLRGLQDAAMLFFSANLHLTQPLMDRETVDHRAMLEAAERRCAVTRRIVHPSPALPVGL